MFLGVGIGLRHCAVVVLCELLVQVGVFGVGSCHGTRCWKVCLVCLMLGVFEVVLFGVNGVELVVQVMSVCMLTILLDVFDVG